MVARSTVSRYVLSTRAVHLPEHEDGGVSDLFRVRELAKSKAAKPSGTLTAREPNGPDGPADGKSPDLRK
jgi:hypothetical protein